MPRVPLVINFDLWSFRTLEGAAVGQKLAGLRSRVTEWLGSAKFHQDEILWRHSRLPDDCKLLKMAKDSPWSDTVCAERGTRARTGVMVQGHQSETESVKMAGLTSRRVPIHLCVSEWEVAQLF